MSVFKYLRIYCPIILLFSLLSVSDSCFSQTPTSSSSFRVIHTSTARFFVCRKYIHTKDNATIVVGKWGTTEDGSDLLIMKMNDAGEVLWSKRVPVGIRLDEYELSEMSDGTIILVSNSQNNGAAPVNSDILMIKFTCQGEVLWSKYLSMIASVPHRYLMPYSIREGKNNDVIVSFYNGQTDWEYTVISRINKDGDLVWSKSFYGYDSKTSLLTVSFLSDDKIVAIGFKSVYNPYGSNYERSLYAMKLNYNDGAVEETKGYYYSEFYPYINLLLTHPKIHFYAEQLNNGNFAIFGEFSNFDYTSHHVFKLILNKDLSIKESKAFSIPYGVGLGYAKISVFPNGETHFVSANYDRKKFYWWAADDQYNKLREKKIEYPDAYLHLQYMALQTGNNRSSYIVSSMLPGKSSIEMVQVENGDKGIMPCLGEDTSFVGYEYLQINTGSPPGWKSVKDNEAVLMPVSLSSIPVPVTTEYLCKPNPVPTQSDNNNFKISGIDTICVSDTTVIYTGKRINKSQPVYWELSSTYNQNFQILNDSTVSIKFVKADSIRQVKLYGYTGSCQVLKDSVLITVFPENNKFHGTVADCDFNFQLHPGKWFKSYIWQDGATDSVYNVTKAGVYTVKLQTYCGNFIKDSIVLMTPAFLLTPGSLSICKGDSGTIQVPEGFKDYMWSPSSNLVKITENTFRIFPEKDTFYVVTAAAIDGCEVQDTVYARVNRAATLDLGKDTIVCSEQAITLYAGSGFISYKWNTGNVTQNITIKASNTPYIILAKDANGCLASDTIIVSKKECSNSIYFPTAFTPNNDGKNDIFKASIRGVLEEYELIIYNRWGEVVFTTNNNLSGWPGIFKGKEQKTDTYVRMCRYKFINEPAKVDKGTVTLIR